VAVVLLKNKLWTWPLFFKPWTCCFIKK